jgi:urease accessory protein
MKIIITHTSGNLQSTAIGDREIDRLRLEWYETSKRILHKRTQAGHEVVMKFLNQRVNLSQDDIIFENDQYVVAIDINPCEAIVVRPGSMHQMARLCYEIGNKHLPLFYEDEALLIPYDAPLFRWMVSAGFVPDRDNRKLLHQLRTSVEAHAHAGGSSLFSKIMNLTASND